MDATTKKLMETIIDKLLRASAAYYGGQETIMSDKEYDELSAKLEALEAATGLVLPNSPSLNVGFDIDKVGSPLQKTNHEYRSLSLAKTKDIGELKKWMGDRECVLSWKCDGLTIILTYDGGKLVKMATRGNGDVGEDITRNAVIIDNVAMTIPDKRHIVIRGEAVVPYRAFNRVNTELPPEKQYKNPRNMAAGAVRVLFPKKSEGHGVRFIPFDLVNARELGIRRYSEGLEFIDDLGMEPVKWCLVTSRRIEDEVRRREEMVVGRVLTFPTDGLVLNYEDLDICDSLGATRKVPRYAMAFKWRDECVETVLRGVEWSVSKTGYVTPIALFDPVEIEGSTVKRANLHSVKCFNELKLGIGDRIEVYKANMIIPKIFRNLDRSGSVIVPDKCPICGAKLVAQYSLDSGTAEIVALRCVNCEPF